MLGRHRCGRVTRQVEHMHTLIQHLQLMQCALSSATNRYVGPAVSGTTLWLQLNSYDVVSGCATTPTTVALSVTRMLQVEESAPSVRLQLQEARSALRNISISDERYQQLKRVSKPAVHSSVAAATSSLKPCFGQALSAAHKQIPSVSRFNDKIVLRSGYVFCAGASVPACRCLPTSSCLQTQCASACMSSCRSWQETMNGYGLQLQLRVKQQHAQRMMSAACRGRTHAWLQQW